MIRKDYRDVDAILNPPEGQDQGVWKYEHLRQFCMELNGLAVLLQDHCTPETCAQMTATEQWIFLCAAHKTPKEVHIFWWVKTRKPIYVFFSHFSVLLLIIPAILWMVLRVYLTVVNTFPVVSQLRSLRLLNWAQYVVEFTGYSPTHIIIIGRYLTTTR